MPEVLTAEQVLDLVSRRWPGEEARILHLLGTQAAHLRSDLASNGGSIIGVTPPAGYTKSTLNDLLVEIAAAIGSPSIQWGGITGLLANQTDLQSALDAKLDDSQATAAGLAVLGAADAAAQRTALGLGTAATQPISAFEPAGAVAAHVAAGDPHPQYLTPAEAGAAYSPLGHTHAIADVTGLQSALDDRGRLSAANTWRATQTLASLTGGGVFVAQKATATDISGFSWNNELGFRRWQLQTSSTDADDLWLVRFDESGTFQGTALFVSAATGAFSYAAPTIFLNQIGQGATPTAGSNALYSAEFSGAAVSSAAQYQGLITSAVTNTAFVVSSVPRTQAAVFTLPALIHYSAAQGVFGAGSSVTTQFGFSAASNLVGAGTNFGFHSAIPAGANRWNFFAAGTADNAFVGNVRIGSTAAPTVALDVTGSATISGTLTIGTNPTSAVQAGTVTGQLARWNQTTGRYEAFDLLGTANTWSAKQAFSRNVPALDGAAFVNGHIELVTHDGSAPRIGFHRVGIGAVALYYSGHDVSGPYMGLRDDSNRDYRIAMLNAAQAWTAQQTFSSTITYGGITQAVVQAGTVTGRAATWNQVAGRYEEGADVLDSRGNLRSVPVNTQNGAYTFLAADNGRKVMKDGATAITYTLPTGLASGTAIVVRNKNAAGNITISRSGTTLRIAGSGTNANATIAPWGEALLHHEGGEEWVISGTGVT